MANDDDEYLDPNYAEDESDNYNLKEEPEPEPKPKRRRATPAETKAATLPIGQAETRETLHGEVRMTRSLSIGGSKNDQVHFSVALPVVVQPEWSLPQVGEATADVCGLVKSIVFSQLGLAFTESDDGVLMEVYKQFPGTERVRDDEPERDEPRQRQEQNGHRFTHPRHLERPEHIDPEVWDDLVQNYGDWYDNRKDKASGKYKPTAPDFKRAEDGETVWLKPYRRPTGTRH